MFDHLSLGVRDLVAARAFYDAFLAPLGHAVASASEQELAYGPGGQSPQFFLYSVGDQALSCPGTHIAFRAADETAVDAAFAAAVAAGASFTRAAGPHPDIAPGYYGAVLFDPDGNKLELVRSGAAMRMAA